MQLHEFLSRVQAHARLQSEQEALAATSATLRALTAALPREQAADLAGQLPRLVKRYLQADDEWRGQTTSMRAFFEQVAEREGISAAQGRAHARAVLHAVNEAASTGAVEQVLGELPSEFHDLVGNVSRSKPS